jgi:hypothetical protein
LHQAEDVQGKKGKDSAAAKYAAATPPDGFSVQEEKPYAEVSVAPTPLRLQIDAFLSYGWVHMLHYHLKTSPQVAHYSTLSVKTKHS